MLVATGALLHLAGCGRPSGGPPSVGDPVPDFAAVSLEGDTLALADLRGGPVVVNLWATWCLPCRQETPFLESLHRRFAPGGLRTLGVSVDTRGARDDVEAFIQEAGVTYTVLLDPDMRALDVFQVPGLPATWVLDGDGRIRFARTGPVSEEDTAFVALLARLTGSSP